MERCILFRTIGGFSKLGRLTFLLVIPCVMSCEYAPDPPVVRPPIPKQFIGEAPLPEFELLEPGTRVGEALVTGWSHPVIRSLPRSGSGAWNSLPGATSTSATRFRTVIAAHLVPSAGGGYRLEKVGAGNAVVHQGEEVVVRKEGPEAVIEEFGFFDRFVLGIVESRVQQGRLIARTPTFALFQTPTVMVVNNGHEETFLNYALLVDSRSGDLTVLSWSTLAEEPSTWVTELLELETGLTFDLALDVRVKRRIGPLPTAWSFAMAEMPPGDPIASSLDFELDDLSAAELEKTLRELVRSRSQK